MKMLKKLLPVAAILLFAGQAVAQSDEDEDRREMEARKAEYSERLREAEERMEQAVRQIAEITRERLPQMEIFQRRIEICTGIRSNFFARLCGGTAATAIRLPIPGPLFRRTPARR